MWENVLLALGNNLEFSHISVVFIGALAGLIIGALPGLSAVSGVALLLPFTFAMDPAQGVIMLASVYMSAEYGGSISAILLNTPGTSGAACTMIDGAPMTQKGEAQEALYLSLLSSVIGGIFGACILLFLTGPLARASLLLGPSEIFWVAVAGLSLVAGLTGNNIVKGLIGVTLGVGLTMVGQDIVTGEMRYTFGDYRLVSGISLVPALLGLFTVAAILKLLEQPNQSVAPLRMRPGVLSAVLARMAKMKKLLAWSSIVGTLVGIVPGAGASISAFMAYGEARRISKNSHEFGKGAWEGVAAPEASNNAVVGGSLVPLLALGIPGSGSAAIMFGALAVHGIIPGPRLFVERGELAYTFIIGLFFTVFALLVIGLLTIRWSSMVVRAPRTMMVPGVLVLAVIGSYGLSNSLFDVYILVTVGLIGYFLTKFDVPVVTIALGFVLGRLMEESLQQTLLLAQIRTGSLPLYLASRPATIVLMLIAFAIMIAGIMQVRRLTKSVTEDDATPDLAPAQADRAARDRGLSMRGINFLIVGLVVAVALFGLWGTTRMSASAALFPTALSAALIGFSLVLLYGTLRAAPDARMSLRFPFDGVPWFMLLSVMAALAGFAALIGRIGFYEAAFLFAIGVTWFLRAGVERGNPFRQLGISLVFAALLVSGVYVAFAIILGIPTPRGVLV
jgi:putative tricarboxylic transport membrane protein